MTRPLVSIVIPTFNRAALLPRAVASVAAQTISDWEIVLVDDGSLDETAEIAGRFRRQYGSAFTYLRQENAGCCAARNLGIDASRGEFVAFLDSDDEFFPHKLERQLLLYEKRSELGLVYSDYSFVDLDGRLHRSTFDAKSLLARQVPYDEIAPGLKVCVGSLFDTLLRGYFVATIVGLVRRKALANVRFSRGLRYSAEWLFYLQIARHTAAGFVDEPLALHHHVRGSVTRTNKAANVRNYYETLRRIERAFPDLSAKERRILDPQLASAALQVAFQCHAAGDYSDARRHFAESLGFRWSADAAKGAVEDWCRGWLRSIGRKEACAL
jgi:glycosyltransferase involved in cell wall biosynthesis